MSQQVSDAVRDTVNGQVEQIDFARMGLSKLEKVDFSTLDDAAKSAYVTALQNALFGAKNTGIVVLQNGTTWVGGRMLGSTAQPQKCPAAIPTPFKAKQEWASSNGTVTVPHDNVQKGFAALDLMTLTCARIQQARVNGNGIHVLGQKGKGSEADYAVANALSPIKGSMA
jgi:hypothetical protein